MPPAPSARVTRNVPDLPQHLLQFVAVACVLFPHLLAAQGLTGALIGTVRDAQGGVLPGATVTLSNPRGSIGGNQETVADARGAFQFIRLVPGAYTVKGELEGFRSVVQENVIVNAVQASIEKKGMVTVTCAQKDFYVDLRVEDTGAGIHPAQLNRIFDPYFTTKQAKSGTGLGLGPDQCQASELSSPEQQA